MLRVIQDALWLCVCVCGKFTGPPGKLRKRQSRVVFLAGKQKIEMF